MRELLRCRVAMGCVALAVASMIGHADEVKPSFSQMALKKPAVETLSAKTPTLAIIPPTSAHHRNLRLDCEKIGQAQRSLMDARRYGAQAIPAAPPAMRTGATPTHDEIYHINRNEERFADLARQFRCGQR